MMVETAHDLERLRTERDDALDALVHLLTALDDPLGTCDWGDCEELAVTTRYDCFTRGWLSVCEEHRL